MTRLESDYYSYMGYDPDNAKAGLAHYLPFFACGPVLELACGRGEFLELLRDAGIEGEGVDLDEGMVERAVAGGLRVAHGDAVSDLEQRPDDSLRGVFSAHFAEHLQPEVLEHVIAESARVLAPGGVFIAATPNAACVSVMGHDFWRDPTHIRFYEPRLLAFYCAKAGMEVVETGGNPLNHPGAPPEALAPPAHVDPDLRGDLVAAIQHIKDRKHGEDWQSFGHFLGVLEERLRATQEELVGLRRSYAHLLDRLYPSNEVYVVARAV
jgi:SAM-dependent methyltransferase